METPDLISTSETSCTDSSHALSVDLQSCVSSLEKVGVVVSSSKSIEDESVPRGCTMRPNADDTFDVVFNTASTTTARCGETVTNPNLLRTGSLIDLAGLVQFGLSMDVSQRANITMVGPSDVWFAVGFNAKSMADEPYTIVVDGNGDVTERKLASHAPGQLLGSTIHIHSNEVVNGTRTIVMSRPTSIRAHVFPTQAGVLDVITAIGSSPKFSYHKSRSGAQLTLVAAGNETCVCEPNTKTFFNYMNETTFEFDGYNCVDEPRSDMLRRGDGTGRNISNAACDPMTYKGGTLLLSLFLYFFVHTHT